MIRPVLYVEQVLKWADAFFRRWGRWPRRDDGPVAGQVDVTWCGIDLALKRGNRGLPRAFGSLAKLLRERRDVRHKGMLPRLTRRTILKHADAHLKRTGRWPVAESGQVHDLPGESWMGIQHALVRGTRGLAGGSSLAQLLAEKRGVRNAGDLPPLSVDQVRRWAVAFKNWMGHWPRRSSGVIPNAGGETWARINDAIIRGTRGLVGYGSLARFMQQECGVVNRRHPPPLTEEMILKWARAFHKRTGKWPNHTSGPIPEAPGDTWCSIHQALCDGRRGLAKSSLFRLLWRVRPRRNPAA